LTAVRVAKTFLVLSMAMTVALLFTTDCAKKPKPAMEPGEVPEESIEAPEETVPPEEGGVTDEHPDEEEISLRLKDIHFDYDDDTLRPDAKDALNANAEVLLESPWVNVQIEGHCDERGTVEYNLALGERRALAAKRYLVSYGIDASRISVISYGKERPIAFGSNEDAWAKNRRDHFVVR
jgi:peptidoglycan-associated lipoprotein